MNLDHIPKNLLAKIQGLLRLEASAKELGSIEEAANASGKIREILMKYNLDLYTVSQASDAKDREPQVNHFEYNPEDLTKPHEGKWVLALAKVIARFNMVHILTKQGADDIVLIGTETNIEITWYTLQQLTVRLRGMAKENFKRYDGKEKRNTYIRGYYLGAVSGIQAQLAQNAAKEAYNAKMAAEKRAHHESVSETESNSLSIMGMQVQMMRSVETYINSKFKVKRAMSSGPRSKSVGGRAQGLEDGKKISINAGLKGGAQPTPGQRRIG